MKKRLLTIVIALICSACNEEPPVNPTPETKLVSIGVGIEKSRVHLAGGKTVWDATDVIGAFAIDNTNIKFTTSVDNLGTFSSLVNGNPTDFYFYYPYNTSATMANGLLSTELPTNQKLLSGTYDSSLPLGAHIKSIEEPLMMNNLCGVLCLTVKSNIDRVLKRLTFVSNDATPIAGKYTVDLTSSDPNLDLATNGNPSISLDGNVAISANQEYKFYVILPPSVHSQGFTITLEDTKSRTCEQTFVKELTVKRSVITTVKTTIQFNSEVEEEEETTKSTNAYWIWATNDMIINNVSTSTVYDATDLSLEGKALANCYIVSEAGAYSIPALKPDGTTVDAANPDTVISFTTSGEEGNAVIAYTNAAGEILWSWHIWCTDTPADLTWNGNTWLDRNLGAITAVSGDVDSYGLMYQWGRKDPFPGSKLYSWSGTNDETTAFSTDYTYNTVINGDYAWQYSSGTGLTVDEAIAQPMHMCQNATAANPDPTCGTDGSKNFNNVTRPWVAGMCAVEYSKFWLDDEKTIYDPCPAGYRVPTQAQVKADFSDLTDQFTTVGKTNGLTLASAGCWLPAVGYRTYDGNGKLFKVGTMGHYWTSTAYFPRSANHHYGATFYTMAIRETTSGVYGITSNGQLKASENAAVRCVKE